MSLSRTLVFSNYACHSFSLKVVVFIFYLPAHILTAGGSLSALLLFLPDLLFLSLCRGGAETAEAPVPVAAGVRQNATEAGGDGEEVLPAGSTGLRARLLLHTAQRILH